MADTIISIGVGTAAWFLVAGALFFNPLVGRVYRRQEGHPAVRALPPGPGTLGTIIAAVFAQTVLWAGVYLLVEPVLGDTVLDKGLRFGGILVVTKMIPRDIDRLLLTTYPKGRMAIELVIGCVCAAVTGLVFAWLL
ncbi:MAG: hypothetical protein KDK70_00820 [Myxococcales bacterium]|nr:hypothetical protein [Myxococcales bacterium]